MVQLRVEDIKKKPRDLVYSEPAATFSALHDAAQFGECEFLTPVAGELHATWEYDHVKVVGIASSRVRLACSRCLSGYEQDISASFVIYYTEATPGEVVDDEIELAEHDLLSASYVGDEIQVDREIAEQLLMELPVKPLCDERCLGLCPSCGVDLNQEKCSCEQRKGSLAFSALQQFTVPRKGE
jgi:uncharacterized protein